MKGRVTWGWWRTIARIASNARIWGVLRGPPTWTLVIREPFGGGVTIKQMPVTGQTLYAQLKQDDRQRDVSRVLSEGRSITNGWPWHRPKRGERIEVMPGTGMKSFTEAYLKRLNAEEGGGRFLKTAIVTVNNDTGEKRYFVANEAMITFDGHDYEPLDMIWQDFEIGQNMSLPTMRILVPNIGGEVEDYVEKIDILENDVVLQVVQFDLLGDANAKDELKLQIEGIEGDDIVASVMLGWNLGFKDNLPRKILLKKEYPGMTQTTRRFFA